jgi:uncharacterized membrane protein
MPSPHRDTTPGWTPKQAVGCAWVAIFAVAVAGFALFAVLRAGGKVGVPAERAALEAERRRLAEQTRAAAEEGRRLHEERIALRKERMRAIADRFTRGEKREYTRVVLRNACPYAVAVALRYQDLDESWVARGWWEVSPGGSVTTDAMTRHRQLHLYAENQAVGRTWDGTGSEGALDVAITDSRFDQVEGEPFLYEGSRRATFFRREAAADFSDLTEVFECPAEAPPPRGAPPSKGEAQGQATGR